MKNNTNYYVYLIRNTKNGRCYVGQTTNPKHRFYRCHQKNKKLLADIDEFGIDAFTIEIIARTQDKAFASSLEKHYIAEYKCIEEGYNSAHSYHVPHGMKRSEQSNAKRRASISKTIWMTDPLTGQTTRANPHKVKALEESGWLKGRVKPDGYFKSSTENKLFNVTIPNGDGDFFKKAQ